MIAEEDKVINVPGTIWTRDIFQQPKEKMLQEKTHRRRHKRNHEKRRRGKG